MESVVSKGERKSKTTKGYEPNGRRMIWVEYRFGVIMENLLFAENLIKPMGMGYFDSYHGPSNNKNAQNLMKAMGNQSNV